EALPLPVRGGNLAELQELFNLKDVHNFKLVVGWLLASLYPKGPFPLLFLHGPEGTAKTTLADGLKFLIDPSVVLHYGKPRNEELINMAGRAGWVQSWDNLSALPDWMSDTFSRFCTGQGDIKRTLYETDKAYLSFMARPQILTAIPFVIQQPDL